ncbi:hypothetical protein E4V01_18610 [Methylorubrum sp. Q1]|uniref:hypothetical protein n=1 Tax=Methylorubrum sp. Q1 TaxID=2562453 RepID=UPI001076528D|nr:hypothetical protein [Methylorubrum sp. Q1]TFZ56583.1 hypothetical protein E4V01_18610 [Methylorubrum sp. Q1]
MIDLPKLLIGIEIPWFQNAIENYWIVIVGVLALFFYGRHHFNTPNYALSGNIDAATRSLVADPSIAKISGLAPPIYTTTRSQYQRHMIRYVAILQLAFMTITFSPELAKSVFLLGGPAKAEPIHVPEAVRERAIWALFILTGLLTSFPAFREIDGFLLRTLHKSANVPTGVENTAQYLFEAKYKPSQPIGDDIFAGIRTHHFREVIAGREEGSLETCWFELRCIREVVKAYVLSSQNPLLQSVLQADIEEAANRVDDMRDHLFRYSKQQDRLLPEFVENIDGYLISHTDEPDLQDLLVQRRKFIAEVKALKLRFCRLCSLAVFAIEGNSENIDQSLKRLGFGVKVVEAPRWHWESILKVSLSAALATLIPSLVYGLYISITHMPVPGHLEVYVPANPLQVLIWVVMAAIIHTVAVIVALAVKRFYARRVPQRASSDKIDNIVCAIVCYISCLFFQLIFTIYVKAPPSVAFAWATLPAVTGYYVGKYVDKSKARRPISNLRSIKQSAITSFFALSASVVTEVTNFNIFAIEEVVRLFIVYSMAVGGLIGFFVGQAFQRTYSHSKWTEDLAVRPEIIESSGARIIEDFIVQRCDVDAVPQKNMPLSGGAGI